MFSNLEKEDHCSDFMGAGDGFLWHGHNEDWSEEVRPFMYLLAYQALDESKANFHSCGGLVYPGMLPGTAVTFNQHGIMYSQNALSPTIMRVDGLATNFVNRRACEETTLAGVMEVITWPNQTMGYSLNVMSVREQLGVNIEVWMDRAAVTPAKRNLSHFNAYKHLDAPQNPGPSSARRQTRADEMPATLEGEDIISALGDTLDPDYPIYRPITLATALLNGITGDLHIWAGTNPSLSEPLFQWNLLSFWDSLGSF
jgi:hypothetical protein